MTKDPLASDYVVTVLNSGKSDVGYGYAISKNGKDDKAGQFYLFFSGGPALTFYPARAVGCLTGGNGMVCAMARSAD